MVEKEGGLLKQRIANYFTSFRFAWSTISLLFSVGTFAMVFSDKYAIPLLPVMIVCFVGIIALALLMEKMRFRQETNYSESYSNPAITKLFRDTEKIKEMLEKQQEKAA